MMKEEETNDPEFSWWEKRLKEQVTTTAYISTTVIMGTAVVAAGTTNDHTITPTALTTGVKIAVGTSYFVTVADDSLFRTGHVIQIPSVVMWTTAGGTTLAATETIKGIITGIDRTNHYIAFNAINATSNYVAWNVSGNLGLTVQVIGSAFAQGVTDQSTECYYLPINIGNYTQIFRTPFSFTGSALVTPVKFDDTGIYKDKAKSHSIDHMIEQELAFIFGNKYRNATNQANATQPVPTTGVGLPIYTTGGILWFLQQWENAGSSVSTTGVGAAGAGTANYGNTAPSAVTATSSTAHDADDNARIIVNTAGTINEATYDTYLERLFRTTNNVSNEKLVLCGSGFLKVMNQMYRSQSNFVYFPPTGDTFGMEIVAHKTAFGTVYYKTHPLFSRNAAMRNNALFMDIHNLRYRPMSKRDTQLLKNRQPNDADYRKDEWFSEAGLELRMPETFMYMQNVQSYLP